jgi:hypothetical protein
VNYGIPRIDEKTNGLHVIIRLSREFNYSEQRLADRKAAVHVWRRDLGTEVNENGNVSLLAAMDSSHIY